MEEENKNERKKDKKGTKTHTTSKTSNKKFGDDSVVIHNLKRNNPRKSAIFKGILPDNGNKIIKVLRRNSKLGNFSFNFNGSKVELKEEDDN